MEVFRVHVIKNCIMIDLKNHIYKEGHYPKSNSKMVSNGSLFVFYFKQHRYIIIHGSMGSFGCSTGVTWTNF